MRLGKKNSEIFFDGTKTDGRADEETQAAVLAPGPGERGPVCRESAHHCTDGLRWISVMAAAISLDPAS